MATEKYLIEITTQHGDDLHSPISKCFLRTKKGALAVFYNFADAQRRKEALEIDKDPYESYEVIPLSMEGNT